MPKPHASRDAGLAAYRRKRDFNVTPEPEPALGPAAREPSFVIQKHAASRLHYDFRLELDGVLLSWAVPKGPSFDPADKRMAIHVEDHPVSYGSFEGTIPPRQYGAGEVIVWDRGTWEPVGDPRQGMQDGKLVFRLHGEKLAGLWELVRIRKPGDRQDPWLLFKKKDEWARPAAAYDVVSALPDSVIGRPLGRLESRASSRRATPRTGDAIEGRIAAGQLEGAVPAALPERLSPQLATLTKAVPGGADWLYEIKFDGYRVLVRIEDGKARLITRGGHDWTAKVASLARAIEALCIGSAWLDGELVVLKEDGTPDFNALQNAFDAAHTESIRCFLFDVPYFEGLDLRRVALKERRALLEQLLAAHGDDRVRFSAAFEAAPDRILQTACQLGLEGVIAKRKDAPYVSRRTETWLKLKCGERQEFVIAGYTERSGAAREIGSLLLGVHDEEGRLVYAGNVGTGWDARSASDLHARLARMHTEGPPFAAGAPTGRGRWTRRSGVETHWVKPRLVAEIAFTEWTPDGHVRHASFQGLRSDKPANKVGHEQAIEPTSGAVAAAAAMRSPPAPRASHTPPAVGTTRISNPDRVIDPSTGL
jgi:bifunctional non-homologous end joining protein LigD